MNVGLYYLIIRSEFWISPLKLGDSVLCQHDLIFILCLCCCSHSLYSQYFSIYWRTTTQEHWRAKTGDKTANVLILASILDKFKGTSICVHTFCRVLLQPSRGHHCDPIENLRLKQNPADMQVATPWSTNYRNQVLGKKDKSSLLYLLRKWSLSLVILISDQQRQWWDCAEIDKVSSQGF